MVFSSILFTFCFLPIVILLYYFVKEKYRNFILLIASIVFYAYGEPRFVFVMCFSIVINHLLAKKIEKRKTSDEGNREKSGLILATGIFLNVFVLFIFKYLDFSIGIVNGIFGTEFSMYHIKLPIGISFFTFQSISYIVDIYRGKGKAQKNLINTALYISFFPQLVAGPIVRYETIEKQLNFRSVSLEKVGEGAKRFMLGFCKKVLIANNLSNVAVSAFGYENYSEMSILFAWLGAISFTFQIFFDFAGYSDMAIGLAKMFGFDFEENFNYPYIAGNVTEFWRRWHISLSSWFRDYVYIPLGGARVGIVRHIFNLFVVWLLTGIWHGANFTFIIWGLVYFVVLVFEKFVLKISNRNALCKCLWRIMTLGIIILNWVIFNSTDLSGAFQYIGAMFGVGCRYVLWDEGVIRAFREYGIYLIAAAVFSMPIAPYLRRKLENCQYKFIPKICIALVPFIYACMFLWATSFLILGSHNPFIYFNF